MSDFLQRQALAGLVFGAPNDDMLRWAYSHGSFIVGAGGLASLCVLPIVPAVSRPPIIPLDYSSPSHWAYVVHVASSCRRRSLYSTFF